jgi:hypothetical protein
MTQFYLCQNRVKEEAANGRFYEDEEEANVEVQDIEKSNANDLVEERGAIHGFDFFKLPSEIASLIAKNIILVPPADCFDQKLLLTNGTWFLMKWKPILPGNGSCSSRKITFACSSIQDQSGILQVLTQVIIRMCNLLL